MVSMTITEALAEIKLIQKKIESKQLFVLGNLTRAKHLTDPLGNGPDSLRREIQAIGDLRSRIIDIRSSIAIANSSNTITINGIERTLQEWLTWKRECAQGEIDLYKNIHQKTSQELANAQNRPQVYKTTDTDTPKLVEIEANVHFPDYIKYQEAAQETLDKLDGQLSLKNATIVITI